MINTNTDFLRSKRLKQDPDEDALVAEIFADKTLVQSNAFFGLIQQNSAQLPENLPNNLRAYFDKTDNMPTWADEEKIKIAEDFFMSHGTLIALILCAKSLPQCYACSDGAYVLYKTGRLNEQNGSLDAFSRRIAETSQFIINCMAPGGLSPQGNGIRTAQKIRLIHASIRYYLHKDGWDSEKYGMPINQEDMAGTLMSFAPLVIEGLEKFGVEISDQEKEAYIHCWRIIGHFVGLDDDLNPTNYADAIKIGYAILDDQKGASEHGRMLTKSLLTFIKKMSFVLSIDLFAEEMVRELVGDEMSEILDIPDLPNNFLNPTRLVMKAIGLFENLEEDIPIINIVAKPLSKLLLEGMLKYLNHGEKIHFFIPPSLTKNWSIQTN